MVQNKQSLQNSQMIKNKTKGAHIRKLSWQKCDVIYEQNNVRASLIEQKYLNHNKLQQGKAKVPHAYVIILDPRCKCHCDYWCDCDNL